MKIDFNDWEPISANAVSIKLEDRDRWSKELISEIIKDKPRTMFIGSGDRIVIASYEDCPTDDKIIVTIEDCIITRRRYVEVTK